MQYTGEQRTEGAKRGTTEGYRTREQKDDVAKDSK